MNNEVEYGINLAHLYQHPEPEPKDQTKALLAQPKPDYLQEAILKAGQPFPYVPIK